jgi:DNA-binding transcriptional ArsR family regulator
MTRSQTESIREFILDRVADSPRSVARQVALAYGISRQAANRHLDVLVDAGILDQDGYTRSREYRLRRTSLWNREIRVTPVLNPDRLWDLRRYWRTIACPCATYAVVPSRTCY